MILKIGFLLCFIIIGNGLHIDHIETGRQLRLLEDASSAAFNNPVRNLKIDLFDIPDMSGLQNLTMECGEDMLLLGLALNGSDLIPSDFFQILAMSKCLST